ncbi:MAG: tRNA(Ser) Um(44) 2'-O-methyltransferase [Ramalina farinacea]|uniref:tRNA (uracil-O(2)-)-methyltransferase n=1 Tax=Ramalina farinacea TaxID=258253 RepID=A0AA43QU52_9LECA|nr:tRNA(Ser) Um(44) 2'-O-methyltransferase [Ramalina farinacea]
MTTEKLDDYTTSSKINSHQATAAIFDRLLALPHESWSSIIYQPHHLSSQRFIDSCLKLVQNPNINTNPLIHSDILYDSYSNDSTGRRICLQEEEQKTSELLRSLNGDSPGYKIWRMLLRRLTPHDLQLGHSIIQSVIFLSSDTKPKGSNKANGDRNLVMFIPHVSTLKEIPIYIPQVRAYAYSHFFPSFPVSEAQTTDQPGAISIRFINPPLGLDGRLVNWSHDLLAAVEKGLQSRLVKVNVLGNSDTLPPKERVQDRYTKLKERHAKRLLDDWAEPAEPSKRIYEDLSTAAFLLELLEQMYELPAQDERNGSGRASEYDHMKARANGMRKPPFPGFVDIGCGTGILVDVLIREGYNGWGLDACKRKTWDHFSHSTRECLKQLILDPAPINASVPRFTPCTDEMCSPLTTRVNATSRTKSKYFTTYLKRSLGTHRDNKENHDPAIGRTPALPRQYNGIFPTDTFIISNHADELSPWTPLLASLSSSPFLCIPCCAHNLSGQRFRAPSASNGYRADSTAPTYFARQVSKAKHVAINSAEPTTNGKDQGSLKSLRDARHSESSSYSSLCDWICHLAEECGFEVEKRILDSPSQRNLAIVGRPWRQGWANKTLDERRAVVKAIVERENVSHENWKERCKVLIEGNEGLSVH